MKKGFGVGLENEYELHNSYEAPACQEEIQRNSNLDSCDAYALYQDAFDDYAFLPYEEWRDVDAFNTYKNSNAFKQIMTNLSPLMATKPDSAYYEAELVGP